jgi:dihydroorotate dehydrogenase
LEYPILTNVAGEGSKSIEQIKRILSSNPLCSAVVGSITLEKRKGNPEPNSYIFEDGTSINLVGLKNLGMEYYEKNLPKLLEKYHNCLLILNIASAPVRRGYGEMEAKELNEDSSIQFEILNELAKIDRRTLIEANLSCPSISDSLIYEDLNLLEKILEKIERKVGERRYTVKVGYMLPEQSSKLVSLISCYNPFGVVAINTMPGFMLDEKGRPYLWKGSGGYVGVGGRRIRPFALYTVSS